MDQTFVALIHGLHNTYKAQRLTFFSQYNIVVGFIGSILIVLVSFVFLF